MTTQEIRERAAQLIERVGWWDGQGKRGRAECLVTAITVVEPDFGIRYEVYTEIDLELNLHRRMLSYWNDSHTRDEVLAALRGTYKP